LYYRELDGLIKGDAAHLWRYNEYFFMEITSEIVVAKGACRKALLAGVLAICD
jgi:hypothetical protein